MGQPSRRRRLMLVFRELTPGGPPTRVDGRAPPARQRFPVFVPSDYEVQTTERGSRRQPPTTSVFEFS